MSSNRSLTPAWMKHQKFLTDWELVKVNDHKSIMLCNVHDMEGMEAFMSTPEMQEWDKANNCVDVIYSMERVN